MPMRVTLAKTGAVLVLCAMVAGVHLLNQQTIPSEGLHDLSAPADRRPHVIVESPKRKDPDQVTGVTGSFTLDGHTRKEFIPWTVKDREDMLTLLVLEPNVPDATRLEAASLLLEDNRLLGSATLVLLAVIEGCSDPRFTMSMLDLLQRGELAPELQLEALCAFQSSSEVRASITTILGTPIRHPVLGRKLAESYLSNLDPHFRKRLELINSPFLQAAQIVEAERIGKETYISPLLGQLSETSGALPALMFLADQAPSISDAIAEATVFYMTGKWNLRREEIREYANSPSRQQQTVATDVLTRIDSASQLSPPGVH